jgi:hypothetical protein
MPRGVLLKWSLVLVGFYYLSVPVRSYLKSIVTNGFGSLGYPGATNIFLDASLVLLGIGLIYTVVKKHKYQMFFIVAASMVSWVATLIVVVSFAFFPFESHSFQYIVEYVLDLICCLFSLVVTIAVWRRPSILVAGPESHGRM